MKIKLSRVKMQGLLELIGYLQQHNWPTNKAERILYLLVEKTRIKLRNRLDSISLKDSYQVTLSEDEALALETWFGQQHVPEHYYTYELNVAQQICFEIDKKYGQNTAADYGIRKLAP